jgi:hypothetical protein
MDALDTVLAGATALVGTHFVLSHPLRRPLVARLVASILLLGSLVRNPAAWWYGCWRRGICIAGRGAVRDAAARETVVVRAGLQ